MRRCACLSFLPALALPLAALSPAAAAPTAADALVSNIGEQGANSPARPGGHALSPGPPRGGRLGDEAALEDDGVARRGPPDGLRQPKQEPRQRLASPPVGTIWSATLNAKALDANRLGCTDTAPARSVRCSTAAVLTDNHFKAGGRTYRISSIREFPSGLLKVDLSAVPNAALRALGFCVGTAAYAVSSARSRGGSLIWENAGLSWSAGDRVSLGIGSACSHSDPPPPAAPAAPTGLSAAASDGRMTLSWTAPAGTVTGYDVRYTSAAGSVAGPGEASPAGDPAAGCVNAGHTGTAASETVSGPTDGREYRVRVRAANAGGAGDWAHIRATPVKQTWSPNPQGYSVEEGTAARIVIRLFRPAPTGGLTFTLKPLFGAAVPADRCDDGNDRASVPTRPPR